jgi:hypothetical protein
MKKNRFLPGLFLSLSLFCLIGPAQVYAFGDIRYAISASFSPKEKKIEAKERLTFRNDTDRAFSEICLRVYPNHRYSKKEIRQLYNYASYFKVNPFPGGFDPGAFILRSVKSLGADLSYEYVGEDQTILKIILPTPLAPGASFELEIDFSLKIPHHIGRYGWHKNTFALNRWYPLLGVSDKEGWRNAPDFLLHMPYVSEAASYELFLEMPQDYVAASGCDIVREEKKAGNRKIVSFSSSNLLRELSLSLSKDYLVHESEAEGTKILSYYFKGDEAAAQKAGQAAADCMRYYTQRFGLYPYKSFSIAPVYLGYGGSQNAGVIFIDERAYRMPSLLDRYFDFLVAHETGHQWWYNMVGNDEYKELWLDEGINSYWVMRYLEDKYGPRAKIAILLRWFEYFVPNPTFEATRTYRYWYFAKKGFDGPVVTEMASFYEPSLIFTVAYGKGSAIVSMLASMAGEEKFGKIMQAYFEKFKFRLATVRDFIKIADDVMDEDLSWFFDEWLYAQKTCDYSLSRGKDGLVLKKKGTIRMPVDVKLVFKDGTQEMVTLDGKDKEEVVVVPKGKTIKTATADPDNKLLDMDRVNNHVPRQVDVKLVPIYHGLYDIPLFIKSDAYSWITGPSFSKYGIGAKTSFQKPGDYIFYAASHYDSNSESLNSSAGFEKNNLFGRYLSWGFEFLNRDSRGDEEEGLRSYKLYLRQELALGYSLLEPSSHLTLYLLHNQSLGKSGFLGAREELRNLNYRQNKETIFGATYYLSNAGAFPDPSIGYKLNATQEIGGHVLAGGDAFSRTQVEYDRYFEVAHGHKLALRLKAGAGYPKDKYLFYLGSDRELRGYDYKDLKGSSMLLGSLEYRFPLLADIDARLFRGVLNLSALQGVFFFDAGSAWFNHFNEPGFKKDVGFGLRFYFDVAGALEKFALRVDAARPLDGEDKDTHVWVGINHAF